MIDPTEQDMQAYASSPSLLQQASQAPNIGFQTSSSAEGSSSAGQQDFSFGELGLDATTQLLEQILTELRTLNQNFRDMS
jgi:hypothetical protein